MELSCPSGGRPASFSHGPCSLGPCPPAPIPGPVPDSAGEFHTSRVSPPPLDERAPDGRPELSHTHRVLHT
uniref:Uncharacterized protein n=1 Tax=Mustela putorius furo TaxID=9669 RepID=M3YQ75_MUSPF